MKVFIGRPKTDLTPEQTPGETQIDTVETWKDSSYVGERLIALRDSTDDNEWYISMDEEAARAVMEQLIRIHQGPDFSQNHGLPGVTDTLPFDRIPGRWGLIRTAIVFTLNKLGKDSSEEVVNMLYRDFAETLGGFEQAVKEVLKRDIH